MRLRYVLFPLVCWLALSGQQPVQSQVTSDRAASAKSCPRGVDNRQSDLCAQWKAADAAVDAAEWAERSTWVSGISGVFVLLAIALAFQANRIARQSNQEQLRAWVSVKIREVIGFITVNDQPRLSIRYRLKNIGLTPAMDVSFFMSMAFGPNPRGHLDATIRHFESQKIDWTDAILFPRDSMTRRSSCDSDGELPEPRVIEMGFYVVARYRTVFSKRNRFTAHLFRVIDGRRDDGKVDLDRLPFGEYLILRPNGDFLGYAS